jgi:invasion protein IalB
MTRSKLLILSLLFLAATPAMADPQSIGSFQSWGAYTDKDNNQTICYISSKPVKSEGNYKSRGPVFAEVTHRPAEHHNGVFNILAGYSLKSGAPATLQLGKESFTLFTHGDAAFAKDADDAKIVAAMRNADTMVFEGASTKGTTTKDTFSLKGMGQAYAAIGKACSVDSGTKAKKS